MWDPVKESTLSYNALRKVWLPVAAASHPADRDARCPRVFSSQEPFAQGAEQAAVLTKSLLRLGLPDRLTQLVCFPLVYALSSC